MDWTYNNIENANYQAIIMGCLQATMPQQYAKVEKDTFKPKKIKVVKKVRN